MSKKKILKYAFINNDPGDFTPSKNNIPKWYKDTKGYNSSNLKFMPNNSPIKNFKSCMPLFDSLTTGYTLGLWTELHVEKHNLDDNHIVRWPDGNPLAVRDPNENLSIPVPAGFYDTHYVWKSPLLMELPKGYSAIMTHPFNRPDLPFYTMTGIVDGGIWDGSIPFFLKKDFEGVIPFGTPVLQIIPFKRDSWKSEKDIDLITKSKDYKLSSTRRYFGYYKNTIWNKKEFE
jgi:hypothetical protein